ncbi:hypothetical protein ESA94_14830 [Lacibacter luteus]|uniref:HTH luxR-type domain-containing protein n=1 Tax=Lacibacter luteus TaxID=2508719 RepID=A0A4Q1CGW2_9BACT|nr:LuxR C-terminal-related transcriptional regulator [Lacibacter luteus]RXK59405.1 hypothetical protein ESA94_14830 [Lacibacter luteus]
MKEDPFQQKFSNVLAGTERKRLHNKTAIKQFAFAKLYNLFLTTDSFYFIVNHRKPSVEYVSKEIEKVLGYKVQEFNWEFLSSGLHQNDRLWFLAIANAVIDFFAHLPLEKQMQYKVRYDIRYRKKNGLYTRLLYQGILLEQDAKGRIVRSFGLFTDIGYLKKEGNPVLSFIAVNDDPSFYDVVAHSLLADNREALTTREKQVLKLMIEGKPSKQIGSVLKISKQTVDTHRKNMLRKKHLHNTGELIGKAIRYGWL